MGDISISAPEWRLIQVGRVVILQSGPETGRLAAIVEVIDHKRVRFRSPNPKMAKPSRTRKERLEAHTVCK